MTNELTIKKYEIVLFFVIILNGIMISLAEYYDVLTYVSAGFFVLCLIMILYWAALIKNKNLSNYELVLCFSAIGGFIYIGYSLLSYFYGIITRALYMIFGFYLPFNTFLLVLFFVFIVFAILLWFFVLIKNSKRNKDKKTSLNKLDMIILFFGVII